MPRSTYVLLGPTQEPEVASVYDPVFELDVIYFEDQVSFVQPIKSSTLKEEP